MICKYCGEEFHPKLNHPGYINVCLDQDCRTRVHEPEKVVAGGEVAAIVQKKRRTKVRSAGVDEGLPPDFDRPMYLL